jgi:predicted short-subunit dehydrogenase-like oxidoreductase (DUF2520 family)
MTTSEVRPILGIIGAGKVGCTLARLWSKVDYRVRAVYSPTHIHAARLAGEIAAVVVSNPLEVVQCADLTLLTVPDDAIEGLAVEISSGHDLVGKAVVHTSGARDATALAALAAQGVMLGSLHPAYPFADVETSMAGLPGATFAVEAVDGQLQNWLRILVEALQGKVVVIPEGHKATYHVALAIASNYMVTLYAIAERLLVSLGTERGVADNALNTLLAGSLENLKTSGIPQAMVGPLTRADVGTIMTHLATLRPIDATLVEVYKGLARLSYPMLEARGIPTDLIEQLFRREENHATNNT